jgi:hypothetical protein
LSLSTEGTLSGDALTQAVEEFKMTSKLVSAISGGTSKRKAPAISLKTEAKTKRRKTKKKSPDPVIKTTKTHAKKILARNGFVPILTQRARLFHNAVMRHVFDSGVETFTTRSVVSNLPVAVFLQVWRFVFPHTLRQDPHVMFFPLP